MKTKITAGALVASGVLATFITAMVLLMPAVVSAQSPLAFGIGPTQEPENGAGNRPYFTFNLEPGAQANDWVMVTNNGAEPVNLNLYAADGITSINGSTAFADSDEIRHNVRAWLSTDLKGLEVPPGEALVVPFQVSVPENAVPGDHVAGWVVEAPPRPDDTNGVGASVTERAGVAVVVTVPGPTESSLLLGRICLNQETGSNYFESPVRNDGDVLTKAEGNLTLNRKNGDEVFSRPAELGSVVPGDATFLRLDAPEDPGPGEYVATLSLTTSEGSEVEVSSDIKITDSKINACSAAASEESGAGGLPVIGDLPGGGTPWAILLALAVLLAVVLGMRTFVFGRQQAAPTDPGGADAPLEIDDDEVT